MQAAPQPYPELNMPLPDTNAPAGEARPAVETELKLSARDLNFFYGSFQALNGISMKIYSNQVTAFIGPSGCGKSTFLRTLNRMNETVRHSRVEGKILLDGDDIHQLEVSEVRRRVGMVFQKSNPFPKSIFENVAYGLRVQRKSEGEITTAVGDVLSLVGLQGYDKQFPNQLSGGEQQRVALARAIVIRPRVLLFDEPLSNLDAKLRVHMRGELRELQKRLQITAVYVTHDQEEAMAISDRIAVMHQGRIVQEGSAETLYHRPASAFVAQFIGRTNLLAGKILAMGPERVEVEVAGAHLMISTDTAGLKAGDAVRLVARPEVIDLTPAAPGSGIQGTVVSRTFLGEKAEYRVQVGTDILQVASYNPGPRGLFAPGQRVTLQFRTDGIPLLPGDAA
jgi:iron(III) transport system ATP-binding protein